MTTDQSKRQAEDYEKAKNDSGVAYERVTYEFPAPNGGQPYRQVSGYAVQSEVAGEPVIRVIGDGCSTSIPFSRVIRSETIDEPDEEGS